MPGYYISYNSPTTSTPITQESNLLEDHASVDGWLITRHTLPKFQDHKFFLDLPSFFFSTDGVLINLDELFLKYHCTNISELVTLLYKQDGETFFRCFRGSFSGIFYDKVKQLMLVFTDHAATRMLFWLHTNNRVMVSSDIYWLTSYTYNMQWDQLGLYELLTYGYMPSHHTVVEGIRRLSAGCYLRITKKSCEQLQYHRFSNHSIHRSQKEEVENIDRLFRQAVNRALKVNDAYGYQNIFPLSGGLDSRMVNWVAHDLAKAPIENFTYGFKDTPDVIEARSIAEVLGHKWHFINQEGSGFLSDIEHGVRQSGMQICYSGVVEVADVFRTISTDKTGIILTGVGGDDILTSPLNRSWKHYNYGECALTTQLYPEQKLLIPEDFKSLYATRNIFYLYARTFDCYALGGEVAFQQFTESLSPYMDTDFLEFVFSIPEKRRITYRLYDKWVITCYPDAARWRHNGTIIGKRAPELFICHRHIPFGTISKRIIAHLLSRFHIRIGDQEMLDDYAKDMNPLWHLYYENNKHYLSDLEPIKDRILSQVNSSSIQAKMQALTVLAAVKMIRENHSAVH